METELGEQLFGEGRCLACQSRDEECWVYSEKGIAQVSKAGSTCARCRVTARPGGCSLSKRRAPARKPLPPAPSLQPLFKGLPPPPPGAGGLGIAA
jgi:hypothetical protein